MLHDTRTLCAFFNYKGDIKMCGFLVVGSEEFELQVFQKALDKAAYRVTYKSKDIHGTENTSKSTRYPLVVT